MITLLLFHSPFIRQIFTWRSSAPDTMSGIVGWNAAQLTPRSWPCTKKKKSGLQNQKKWFFISITQSNGPMDHAHGYKRCLWFSLHVKKTQGTAPLRFDHRVTNYINLSNIIPKFSWEFPNSFSFKFSFICIWDTALLCYWPVILYFSNQLLASQK